MRTIKVSIPDNVSSPVWGMIPKEGAEVTYMGTIEWCDRENETAWEFDPCSGLTRHKGFGPGCFWTDWE